MRFPLSHLPFHLSLSFKPNTASPFFSRINPFVYLQSLPSSIVDVSLQLPRNHRRDPLAQPHVAEEGIVPLLGQGQLPAAP